MSITVYLFETRAIQSYLFEGGKLRDMVAASNQLDSLCKQPLDQVLSTLNLIENEDVFFSRRAGGAIYAVLPDEENAQRLQTLWSLYVRKQLPGVELVQVISTQSDIVKAMASGLEKLAAARNRIATQFPIPGPLVMRTPRTGKAAYSYDQSRKEYIDEAGFTKSQYNKQHATDSLVLKFASHELNSSWPNNLEADAKERAFPFIGEDRSIALVHADGNGLGEILRVLNEAAASIYEQTNSFKEYVKLYSDFSIGLESAVIKAASAATQKHLIPAMQNDMLPARPLVLGGDDITLIVRSDLAIPFVETFCVEFEVFAKQEMQKLITLLKQYNFDPEKTNKLESLTACAGICYIKASQPFTQAHHLAESLCTLAKKKSKQVMAEQNLGVIPASVSFHKVSGALIEDVDQVRKYEWAIQHENDEEHLSLEAYAIKDQFTPLPTLHKLVDIFATNQLNKNALREIAGLLKTDRPLAEKRYKRWRDVSDKRALKNFDLLMNELCEYDSSQSPLPISHLNKKSPLVDLLALASITTSPIMEAE